MKILLPVLAAFCLFSGTLHADNHPGALVLLLGGDNVRKELAPSKTQVAKLDALRAEYRSKARSLVASGTKADAGRLASLTDEYDAKALATLTPAQQKSLRAIEFKALGPWMLTASGVQELLGLSPAQKARIGVIAAKMDSEIDLANSLAAGGKISNAQRVERLRAVRHSLHRDLDRVLTPSQRRAFAALAGGSAA